MEVDQISITITDQTGSNKASLQLVVPSLQLTARELIQLRVHHEFTMAMLNYEHLANQTGIHGQPNKSWVNTQFVWTHHLHKYAQESSWELEAEKACKNFEASSFIIMAAGRQLTDLDEPFILEQEAEVKFIRLIPLIGG